MDPTKVTGRRVVAFLFDLILTSAINLGIFFSLAKDQDAALRDGSLHTGDTVIGNITINGTTHSIFGGTAVAYFLLTLAIGIGYWVWLQGAKGFTLGKLLTGIRVQREDGAVPGFGKAFARQFLWIADGFPYVIPYLTGFILAATGRHQRLGDRVANTVVVRKEAFGSPVGNVAFGGSTAAPPPLAPEFQPQGSAAPPNWPS